MLPIIFQSYSGRGHPAGLHTTWTEELSTLCCSCCCRWVHDAPHPPSHELKETLYNAAYYDGAHGLQASTGMAIVTAGAVYNLPLLHLLLHKTVPAPMLLPKSSDLRRKTVSYQPGIAIGGVRPPQRILCKVRYSEGALIQEVTGLKFPLQAIASHWRSCFQSSCTASSTTWTVTSPTMPSSWA